MSSYTKDEIVALKEFRKRVADVLPKDDFCQRDDFLIRWIRARELNLEKAEDMIRKSMQWRAENKIDSLLKAGPDLELSEKFPFYIDGVDKTGRPVVTMHYGSWDVRSFIESDPDGTAKFARHMNYFLESIVEEIKRITYENDKNGNDDDESSCVQFVVVSDMSGYSYRQLANMKAVQSTLQMVSVYEAHYPETLGQCIVINAPAVFSILFGMMKAFMSGRTVEKIQVFSDNKEQWQPVVLDLIEPDQIREAFGGTKI